jgi:hypothetical protein
MEKLNPKIVAVAKWLLKTGADAVDVFETEDQFRLSGSLVFEGFSQWMEEGWHLLEACGALKMSSLRLDGKGRTREDLPDLRQRKEPREGEWRFSLNKASWLQSFEPPFTTLVFFREDALIPWLKGLDPFSIYPEAKRIRIYCPFFEDSMGGNGFQLMGSKGPEDLAWPGLEMPTETEVREEVLITRSKVLIRPQLFQIRSWKAEGHPINALLAHPMYRVLAASLAREFEGPEKVVFRGELVKRTYSIPGPEEGGSVDLSLLSALEHAVHWAYEKNASTRLALLSDRLTIEMEQEKSLLQNLTNHLASALAKAKEDYIQVVRDRKTKYYKELGELVKDIQGQAARYGEKIRSLTNSMLRDLLGAGIIFVFENFRENEEPSGIFTPSLLLWLAGVYILASYLVQFYINKKDLEFSDGELNYWQKSTSTALSPKKIEEQIEKVLAPRKAHYQFVNTAVGIIYALMAVGCFAAAILIQSRY